MTDLIAALDVPNFDEGTSYALKLLDSEVKWVKLGLELFTSCGPSMMSFLKNHGFKVMLDLKLHDIPETVQRAAAIAADLGADMITVHCTGGPKVLAAAKKGAGTRTKVLGVTVLTSHDESDLDAIGFRPYGAAKISVKDLVFELFRMADKCGLDGVVCSALEVGTLKLNTSREMLYVTPGIRLRGADQQDQQRVATPAFARQQGATHVVVGRPIRDAADPIAVTKTIRQQLETGIE
jgi:orotidine-5'-phosphate decarboxylase